MALLTSTQYLPPPSLTSDRYATDLEEIRLIGRRDSTMRTDEQTEIARLWAGVANSGTGTATIFFRSVTTSCATWPRTGVSRSSKVLRVAATAIAGAQRDARLRVKIRASFEACKV